MVSGPEQSHNLPPWLQVQRPQSEPHDVHKSAAQPAEKQAPRPTSEPAQPEIRRTGGGKRRKVEPENTQASDTLTPRIDASMPKPSATTQRAHTNTTREERTGRVTAAAHAAVSASSLEPVTSGAHAVRSSSETKNNRTVRGDEAPTNTAPTSAASTSMASPSEATESSADNPDQAPRARSQRTQPKKPAHDDERSRGAHAKAEPAEATSQQSESQQPEPVQQAPAQAAPAPAESAPKQQAQPKQVPPLPQQPLPAQSEQQPQAQQPQQAQAQPQPPQTAPQQAPGQWPPSQAPQDMPSGQYLAPPAALDQTILVNPVKAAPKTGWRKFVHTLTAGHVNLGDSEKVARHQNLVDLARSPLKGDYRIAVLSLKGGVGKTTTSVMLGGIFASLRGDRVIAIDANPDLGTLAQRAALPGSPTIRDLLNAEDVSRYSNIRMYTTQAESRLEVIGSDRDPEVSEAFSEEDYRHAIDILQHHYNVILTDCGTGLMHSAMAGVLDLANTLILVTSPALDGAQSASATLDWLNHHGYGQLVSNAIVVVSSAHPGNATIDVDQLMEHFKARTRAVQLIPYDRHLSEGAIIDLERLDRKTYMAYLELAGLVAQDFSNWHRHAE
ncbi:MinD/ParA family protein [Corynebacterium durum]|uniref:MinD/ParA family protein n=1 Tax=Corynebacterium durum TaxID=61592 RepID=UPI0028895639|nr:MinD/ParA family protein [Corynebacterium durum]